MAFSICSNSPVRGSKASQSSKSNASSWSLQLQLFMVFIICAAFLVSSSAAESSQLVARLRAGRDEIPIMAFLNDEGDVVATAKRNEPWMSILASNLFKEANMNAANMNYRGLRG
ncbi:hypothetical protein L596_030800 [Steinernema carpocapsae]|uniref:Uncharacterized protein n=1 Tax=Steinernema carpocapsae TaxID=34508 RepID=A0A4U5LNS8_STECR|nr:hypothetical protein L596_030800 [Steinernema carpocapsae]